MKKIGIGIEYSNICKDYNTFYLDRDNLDPETSQCMKKVMAWSQEFLSELLDTFEYKIFHLNSSAPAKVSDISSKRFLFYSLEKGITLQSYVLAKEFTQYEGLAAWEVQNSSNILVQNDEDGGSLCFYVNENSQEHKWITARLKDFSLDEVPFSIE
ncbi:hypothetical protein LCX93_02180 [Sulfurimonas sp. SWIR-19]|uniref:hypothetical protein n=1 Tax=Sulfurimonas sp. SWIR-19 TaxID=2878390 RepID=UPI001CF42853|nr:hypothetical protein [Sulfurimonas sp. SWIR-19]UCN00743.1 hypothetical protein LCX93_02180 [Sulfurimonas sp. SWIR-19]